MSEVHDRQVRVTIRRQVSDGNYGTDAAEVTVEDWVEDDEDASYAADGLLLEAQRLVYGQLARSSNSRVAAQFRTPAAATKVATGPVAAPADPDDDSDMPF
jgi:hypothetical protein